MQESYTKNYVKIYLWQGISILLGFLSLFIVVPKLTSSPAIYGIYSICVSVTFFLTYADIGFLGAAFKYVSEQFAINDLKEEIRILGFVSFILFVFVALFSVVILAFAIDPHLLIKNLNDPKEIAVASKLLLILSLFSPTVILQKLCQIVFGIRLEDFIYQRFSILVNLARVCSVFYFFNGSKYDIVGYFLFYQITGLIANIIFLGIIKTKYHYDFGLLARSFRFSRDIFNRTKRLAFGTFFTTLVCILYYELDLFAIGKLSGAEMAALYAVGLTVMGFFRGILGVIYGPFLARFNHFMGQNDMASLRRIIYSVIVLTLPLVVFPVVSVVVLMRPVILCWVGANYIPSILVAQFLVMSWVYNFFVQPAGILVTTQVRVKAMGLIAVIAVIIYWGGIFATYSSMGILSFAVFKFIAFTVSAGLYFVLMNDFLKFKAMDLIKKVISPAVVPTLFLVGVLAYAGRFMPAEKNKLGLLVVIGTGGLASFVSLCLYYVFSVYFRDYVKGLFAKLGKA